MESKSNKLFFASKETGVEECGFAHATLKISLKEAEKLRNSYLFPLDNGVV